LTVYELTAYDVADSPQFLALMDPQNTSDREKRIMAQMESSQRLVCSHLKTAVAENAASLPAKYLFIVAFDIASDHLEEFHAWYDTEHLPMLIKVPGWIRSRRYKLESFRKLGAAEDPLQFIAVHEIDSLDALESGEFKEATSTPWRNRNVGKAKRKMVRVFEHYKTFQKPE
jgi:hypothetical protein